MRFPIALSLALVAIPCAAEAVVPMGPMMLDGHLLVESRDAGQRRVLRSPAQVRSGDRLIFLIRYRNGRGTPLRGYDFVAPVPPGVRILPDRTDAVRVSVDGGQSLSRPDAPVRIDARGQLRSADDLRPTHVRLRLDRKIAPGE